MIFAFCAGCSTTSGFTFLRIDAYYQEIVKGDVIASPPERMLVTCGRVLADVPILNAKAILLSG